MHIYIVSLSNGRHLTGLRDLQPRYENRGYTQGGGEVRLARLWRVGAVVSHPDLRDKAGCVSYVRQRRTSHIMTKCIEINVLIIIT
jgi:hypothetical protein